MTTEPKAVLIQQLKWLNHLQTLQNKPVLVKGLPPNTQAPKDILPKDSMTFHGHKWNFYKDTWAQLKEPYFTRSILQCEIVFDPDTPIWKDMKEEYGKLIETLDRLKIPYLLTYSGGKGCHLHIFFDMHTNIPEELFDRAKKAEYDITEAFREYLFYYIVGQAKIDLKKLKIDLPKITFQVKSMGSQIRDFGTMRTNGFCKTLITKVPDHQPETPSPPVFPDKVELWKIPEMHKDVLIQKIEEGIIGQVEYNKEIPKNITGIDSIDTIQCIANILPGLDAGRYYGACAIALIGKELSYSWEKIEPLVSTYLNKCKGLSRDDIEIRITESENIYESSKRFSCKYIRDNLNCPSPGGCIVTQKRKEANNGSMKSCYNDLLGDVAEREERKQAALDLSGIPTDNFIMKYIIYAMRMTDAYPEYHLGNAFFLLSIAANRKIQVRFAHDTIYPNIWMFLIGDSTIARKTASITIGHEKIGVPVFGFNPFLPQSTSPEALIEELSNNSKASLVRDEAGGFLRELDKNYMAGFKDVLCSLYDNKDYHRKIRTSQRKNSQTDFNIKNPYVNVLFATTPDIFKNYTNYLDVTSGWLVRFLYITPDHEKEWKGYRKETIDDITLKNKVREQLELIKIRIQDLPDVVDYELSNEAEEFFTKWQRDTETEAMKSKDKNKLRVLGRMHNYAIKISMLLLLGDNTDQTIISKNYIEIACRMIDNYFLINSCNLMEDICRDEKHNLQDKVIGVLKTYGRLSLRDIMRYTHQPKNDLFAAIDALDENGSFEIKKICEDGKKTVFYELNGTKSIKSKITNVPIVADVANVPDVPEIKGIIATNVTGDINIHQMTNDKSVYLCDSRDKSDKRDSCDSRDKKNTQKKESKNDDIEQSRLNNIHRDQIERKGKEWEDQNKKSINSSTLTEFCGWYYNQHKDNDPSEIAELAKRIYSIPDYPAPRKYISILGEELTLVYNDISDLVQATKEEQEKVTA